MGVTPSQLVALLRSGTAPRKAREAIARCAVQLPPATLLEALDILADDPEAGIQEQALSSLERLPAAVVRGVASAPAAAPELLDRIARRYPAREDVALDVARNPAAAEGTLAFLASSPFPPVLAAVGAARERPGRPAVTDAAPAAGSAPAAADAGPREDCGGLGVAADGDGQEVDQQDGKRTASKTAKLLQEPIGEQVSKALKGDREERNTLIRSNNKMVCLKVLENPRVGDSDVEAWARSTNVSEDVLRGIANNKEWCKKYSIVKGLVCNPRAPLGLTLEFLHRMTLKDLEQLAKNRNVPETLRSAARRLYTVRRDQKR